MTSLLFSMLLSSTAMAEDDRMSEMNNVTHEYIRIVMLKKSAAISLNQADFADMLNTAGFFAYDMQFKSPTPNDPQVVSHCKDKGIELLEKTGVLNEYGQAELTLKAFEKACQSVYSYDTKINHGCKRDTVRPNPQKKETFKPYHRWACDLKMNMRFNKFKPNSDGPSVQFVPDTFVAFKGNKVRNVHVVNADVTGTSTITVEAYGKLKPAAKKRWEKTAKRGAEESAITQAGNTLKMNMKSTPEFEIKAPITSVSKGTAYSCMDRSYIKLDTPFIISKPIEKDGKKVNKYAGFAKARKIYDGCTLTTKLKKKQEAQAKKKNLSDKEKVTIKPMASQIILGSPKPMYILTEMPSLNINIAAGGGLALDILQIGAGGPSISFAVEQNIATFTGVSELYAHVGIMTLGAFYVAELGVYKKAYLGPMFFEAGLGIQGNDNENYGGRIFAGTGFQLAPRWALRARASAGMPTTGAHVEAVYTY